jgi:hypothetical protein
VKPNPAGNKGAGSASSPLRCLPPFSQCLYPTIDDLRLRGSKYWYLATPYSRYVAGVQQANLAACLVAGRLIELGIPVFSPIAHSHAISEAYVGLEGVGNHKVWLRADQPLMDCAHGLLVIMMLGWTRSVGVRHEILRFRHANKPIYYVRWPLEY